jgi:hypothetical protein
MAEGKIPVDFEKKVKQAASPNGLGSPVQISARDLMENFNYLLDLIPTLEATTATAVVIGDTFAGSALSRSAQSAAWNDVRPLWVDLSQEFARGAQGAVHVFQNSRGLSLDSIWRTEYQDLLRNPSVTSINYHVVMPDGSVVPVP